MKEFLSGRKVRVTAAFVLALGLVGCTASGSVRPKNDELYHTVQIEPEPTMPATDEQEMEPEFDVLGSPVFMTNEAEFVITNGYTNYDQKISCNNYDLIATDPSHPSVEQKVIPDSPICANGKVTSSDWPLVESNLQNIVAIG